MVAFSATLFLSAQTHSEWYLKSNPIWIQMMSDTTMNYVEAKHAFEVYWEDRELPTEEHEIFAASEEAKKDGRIIASKKRKTKESNTYAFEYKKFKHWLLRNEPFVKEDGYIMTPSERLQQWQIQMQNRK